MAVAIEFKNVSKTFQGAGYPAVKDVSLTVNEGEFVTILGSSGCGKTTLLKMVNRLISGLRLEGEEGGVSWHFSG